MTNGDTVFSCLTNVTNTDARAFAIEWEVIDAENRVVKGRLGGGVRVLPKFETIHGSERDAWEQAARELLAVSEAVKAKAAECLQRAAAAGIVRVPA